jgi:hypothetical protein
MRNGALIQAGSQKLSEWIGGDFDPNFVDVDGLANEVTALAKAWSRKPAAKRKRRS